jgi:SAM-dependent methyltransferase
LKVLDEAEEYELFGYPNTTMRDCDFLEDIFAKYEIQYRDVLDIACGTGRHALEMVRRGYNVTGLDHSESMLDFATKKASSENLTIRYILGDMRNLSFNEEFDAAYILFNTIVTLTSNDELLAFMKGVHCALREDGLFIIETGNIWAYIAEGKFKNDTHERKEENAGVKRHVRLRTVVGPHDNIYSHRTEIEYWRNDEKLRSKNEVVNKRIFSISEMDLLCRLTEFEIMEVYGSTDIGEKILDPQSVEEISNPSRHFVFILRKTDVT